MATQRNKIEEIEANKKRAALALFSELEAHGFRDRKARTAWRRTNRKIDVFYLQFLSPSVCRKWRVPTGSFSLEPGCFFPFIPSLNGKSVGEDQSKTSHPWHGLCQIGLVVFKYIHQRECPPSNIWWVGAQTDYAETVIADVLNQVRSKVLPFYSRFEDAHELLRTLLEEDDALGTGKEGIRDIGNKDSPVRLFYTGFAALEREQWEQALAAFVRCREKALTFSWKDRPDILSCIGHGLERAKQGAASTKHG
jgi:hypothetical protein